ncbi:unnamed protein product, partial [Meganyctiphanes norvegica]
VPLIYAMSRWCRYADLPQVPPCAGGEFLLLQHQRPHHHASNPLNHATPAPILTSSHHPPRLNMAAAQHLQQQQIQQQLHQQQLQQHFQQCLQTPHISGHMFHFPSLNNSNSSTLNNLSPPTAHHHHSHCVCSLHGTLCTPPAAWPGHWADNRKCGIHSPIASPRMHTSGGGIVPTHKTSSVSLPDPWENLSPEAHYWTGLDDERVLSSTRRVLEESGWYWSEMSWQQAVTLLQPCSVGTFLLRDSYNARFLYSLSVQTERGPTSVRIHYSGGKFRLDCESHMASTIPDFTCIVQLLQYYIRVNEKIKEHVWVDEHGKKYSPITVRQPYKHSVASLKHQCRLKINSSLPRTHSAAHLPPTLFQYLDEYPYWC